MRILVLSLSLLLSATSAAAPQCNTTAFHTIASRPILALKPEVANQHNPAAAILFSAGMSIDADGSPRAYHPKGRGLDALKHAGRPGNWWALVTHNGKRNGRPLIQKASDPAPGFYVSQTSLFDRKKALSDPHRYVNAETVPYIVLPNDKTLAAKLGDIAIVYRPAIRKFSAAIFADRGSTRRIGEGSIALARRLGINSNARTGGSAEQLLYLVFANSNAGWPRSVADIDQQAATLLRGIGGAGILDACLAAANK